MNKGILLILDGYGESNHKKGNAVANAKTPTLNKIKKQGYACLSYALILSWVLQVEI